MSIKPDAAGPTGDGLELAHPAGETYRRLRLAGFTAREAGTLAGWVAGVPVTPGGWSITEVERLLFVRALVRAGRLRS